MYKKEEIIFKEYNESFIATFAMANNLHIINEDEYKRNQLI
jgi:hypothetical protein